MASNDKGVTWTDRQLWQAAREADLETLKQLLNEACASDPDRTTPFDDGSNEGTLLHYAAQFNWSREVIEVIAANGLFAKAGIDVLNKKAAQSPLHRACLHGYVQAARTFIELGADVTLESPGHGGCLHQAARGGSIPVINLIFKELEKKTREKNVDIQRKDNGRTPLFEAVLRGRFRAVDHLLSIGANANAKDKDDNTPLHILAQVGPIHATSAALRARRFEGHIRTDRSIVLALVGKGKADINAVNFYGATPLHYAAFHRRDVLVEELKKAGADESIADSDGNTAATLQLGSSRRFYAPRPPNANAKRRDADTAPRYRRQTRPPTTKKDDSTKAEKSSPTEPAKTDSHVTKPSLKEAPANKQEQQNKDDGPGPRTQQGRRNDQRKFPERQATRSTSGKEEVEVLRRELQEDRKSNAEKMKELQAEIDQIKKKLEAPLDDEQ